MKKYTIIPNELCAILKPRDLYLTTVLYLTANITTNYTDCTINQLSKLSNLSIGKIKDDFIPELKKTKCIDIKHTTIDNKTRNTYKLPIPKAEFRIITKEIYEDTNLAPEEKGFLIGLFMNCHNGSKFLRFKDSEMLEKSCISTRSYYRYKRSLIQKGYIEIVNNSSLPSVKEKYKKYGISKFTDSKIYCYLNCPWLITDKNDIFFSKPIFFQEQDTSKQAPPLTLGERISPAITI